VKKYYVNLEVATRLFAMHGSDLIFKELRLHLAILLDAFENSRNAGGSVEVLLGVSGM